MKSAKMLSTLIGLLTGLPTLSLCSLELSRRLAQASFYGGVWFPKK